jgi:tryptophanyl-tRNA synthetase
MTLTLAPAPATTEPDTIRRRLSGFKPTGRLHLGNYLGAIRPMLEAPTTPTTTTAPTTGAPVTGTPTTTSAVVTESVIMVADLHALTVEHDPQRLRTLTAETLATLLACGCDETSLYAQSDVPEHAELHYLLECATGYGEAARMVQFRQKAAGPDPIRLSMLTYPVLMAADILLHDATEVPVGTDQTQHLELARDVANRFNTRYGRTFTVPRAVHPPVGARVMDLADPTGKMGKSSMADSGLIALLDKPDLVRRKVARAVTDGHGQVVYDPRHRPALANLLEILAACQRDDPAVAAERFATYAQLKEALAEAVVETLAPIQRRYAELVTDRGYLETVRRAGAERVRERAGRTVARAKRAIGLH